MAQLTTQVYDTANNCPAAGVLIRLYSQDAIRPVAEARTNAEGRCDKPLLEGAALRPGHYTLELDTGHYFEEKGMAQSNPPFLDVIEVAFSIADTGKDWHLTLRASPDAYSVSRLV